MKHNWEYKRLGDICTVNFGKRIVAKDTTPGPYKVYGGGGATFTTLNFNRENCTIVSRFAMSSNCVRFVKGKFFLNDSGLTIETKIDFLTQGFIDKFLWVNQPLIYGLGRGMAQKNLNVKALLEINVPVPPMDVQEQIVAELDKINETIEDCRELLRNLDALAQSLFYDFFGDPITNPKGWPLYKLSSISQLINGRAYKQNELLDEGKYKVIRVGNFFTNSDYYYSDLELSPEKYIDYGDLIFAWSASFGAFIWQGDKVIYHYHIWKILFDDNLLNKIFYKFLLNEMTSSFMKDLHGIGMMHLTKAGMENYMLPVPPLSLQEQFAARIEQIEAQKKAVEQTIAELQTLLDSRMDYWFN